MSKTTSSEPIDAGDPRDLDARAVVEAIVEQRATADRAEARLLALAVHFVDLHPVTDDHPAATWALDGMVMSAVQPDGSIRQVGQVTDRVAGVGAPQVAQHAVEELGAALLTPYRAALGLVRDALELRYRLPRLWELVQVGSLQTWKARQVTALTTDLSPAAASFVDRHLAHGAARNRVPTTGRLRALVHEALLQHDPEAAAGREEAALAARGVWFDHRESTSTSRLTATLDTLDALDLDASVSDLATELGRLGDSSPLDVRRSHALALLGRPQPALDLSGPAAGALGGPADSPAGAAGSASASGAVGHVMLGDRPVLRPRNRCSTQLYVHVSLADLVTATRTVSSQQLAPFPTADVEQLGASSLDLVRDWLARSDRITVRPVLHASDRARASQAVDEHDPPEWMRETVVLRDGHCVFPGCGIDARSCDQDHRIPFVPIDEGGPPGQTSVEALACLCRRHHRLKTFTAWRYRRLVGRDDDGIELVQYQWTSPNGHSYLSTASPKR